MYILLVIFQVHFSWMFFIGTIPAFVSFFAVGFLTHYGDWDPILVGLKKLVSIEQQVIVRYAESVANYHDIRFQIDRNFQVAACDGREHYAPVKVNPYPPLRDMWGFSGDLSPYWQFFEFPV